MEKKNQSPILGILKELDLYFSAICLIVLIAITFIGVVFRYIFNSPISWLEEVQLMLLLWIGFVSAGAAFRAGSHVAIEMLVEILPKSLQRIIEWFNRIVISVLLVFLTKQCWDYFMLFMKNGRKTPVLRIPYAAIYSVMPLTCILMITGFIIHEVSIEINRRNGKETGIHD